MPCFLATDKHGKKDNKNKEIVQTKLAIQFASGCAPAWRLGNRACAEYSCFCCCCFWRFVCLFDVVAFCLFVFRCYCCCSCLLLFLFLFWLPFFASEGHKGFQSNQLNNNIMLYKWNKADVKACLLLPGITMLMWPRLLVIPRKLSNKNKRVLVIVPQDLLRPDTVQTLYHAPAPCPDARHRMHRKKRKKTGENKKNKKTSGFCEK